MLYFLYFKYLHIENKLLILLLVIAFLDCFKFLFLLVPHILSFPHAIYEF